MISFRSLQERDFPMLLDWLQRPHVKQWWDDGDQSLEDVAAHYSSDPDTTFRYIVVDNGLPLGYIQYYLEPEDVVGIDLFIGDAELLDRGIGTEIVSAFVGLVDLQRSPKAIVIDPDPDNKRAIRCYEKAGFQFDRVGTNTEGNIAYFMKLARHT